MKPATLDRSRIAKVVRAFLDECQPPEDIREKLDFGFRHHDQSVELLEIRPQWRQPGKSSHAFAKATFVKARGVWKIYWMRGNLKWQPYKPSTARSLNAFLKLVKEDEFGCFFG